MSTSKSVVESFRGAVQDLLVPELKSMRVSIDSMRTEMQLRNEKLEQMILSSDEKHTQAIRALSEKLDFAIDIRERLATLEARLPRQ